MPRSVTVPIALPDEPAETLSQLVQDYGASVVMKSLARVLRKARHSRRTEGELEAARALRCAAATCDGASEKLAESEL